jgi:hypothetical protein
VRLAAVLALLAAALLARQAVPRRLAESSDPLASLAAGAPSRLWDLAFWSGQQAGGTALWRGALLACRGRRGGAYPNCTSVRLASWWGPAAAAPPIALLLAPAPAAAATEAKEAGERLTRAAEQPGPPALATDAPARRPGRTTAIAPSRPRRVQ